MKAKIEDSYRDNIYYKHPPLKERVAVFYVKSTDHPVIATHFKPKIPWYEFVIYIGSIIGLWFGVSILELRSILSKRSSSSINDLNLSIKMRHYARITCFSRSWEYIHHESFHFIRFLSVMQLLVRSIN